MFEASDQRASPDPIGKHTLLFCYPALSLGDALRSEDGGLFFLHFLSEKKHGILRYDIAQDRGRDTYPQISTIFLREYHHTISYNHLFSIFFRSMSHGGSEEGIFTRNVCDLVPV